MSWQKDALCEGSGDNGLEFFNPMFFEGYEQDPEVAQEVDQLCNECPVKMTCLVEAIRLDSTGAHGGIYLSLGHFDKNNNTHKSQEQRKTEDLLVKNIRREIRLGNV